jgi:hypothetical protein
MSNHPTKDPAGNLSRDEIRAIFEDPTLIEDLTLLAERVLESLSMKPDGSTNEDDAR